MLDGLLGNPLLRRALAAGEEGVGKVVGTLLGSSALTTGLGTVLSGALEARRRLEGGLRQALQAARVPTQEDVEGLRRRLDELEAMIDGMSDRVGRGADRPGPGAPDGPDGAA